MKPPIKALLEHYGAPYVPEGHRWKSMRCPFQGTDRKPSASVNTDKELFRCFACGVSGDAYDLVMWKEGIRDFASAVAFIEGILGAGYRDISPSDQAAGSGKRRRVFEDTTPVVGQRQIIPNRVRRKPFTGT